MATQTNIAGAGEIMTQSQAELEKQAREYLEHEAMYDGEVSARRGQLIAKFPTSAVMASFAAQVREQSKWVSVASGELPKDDSDVLLMQAEFDSFTASKMCVGWWDKETKVWESEFSANHVVTHWQPLPAPPSTSQER